MLRVGKVKESVLKRSVLRQIHNNTVCGSPAPGEDVGLFPVSVDNKIAVRVNPVEGWTMAPRRAVYGAVNRLMAAGAAPEAIAVTILMPEGTEESQLKQLMREMDSYAQEEHIQLLAGHTAVSPFVNTLILSITAIGMTANELGEEAAKADLYKNYDLVVAGTVGREGAAMIAREKEELLRTRYGAAYIETAKHLFDNGSMRAAAKPLKEAGAVNIHDIREGGIFAGFWEMAAAMKVGLDIDLKKIPIKQHTIEVCEYFNLNPYMLRSGGCLLIACENGQNMVSLLQDAGITAAVVGRSTDQNDRIIRYDDEIRFLEPPKVDEYYKIIRMENNNA